MAQLIVRNIEEQVVEKLKEQAAAHGVSVAEEHRGILRAALLGTVGQLAGFKAALLAIPNVGEDADFERSK